MESGHEEKLEEFKQLISEYTTDQTDYELMKWLKARTYDVPRAVDMFKESMVYRKQIGLETLEDTYKVPEVLVKYLPGGFAGYDKDGAPVRIECYGSLDVKGLLYSTKRIDIEKTKMLFGEFVLKKLIDRSQKCGKQIDGMTIILDMDHSGACFLWGQGMKLITHMGKIVQDNYPEVVKRTFIINAPTILPILWKMIRPMISEEMKSKVCILGGDYKRELAKYIDADQLPVYFGGSRVDKNGDPKCSARICQGGKVPQKYYLKDMLDTEHMTKAVVSRGQKIELKYEVEIANSIIRYEFITGGFDVSFGISSEDGKTVLRPLERVDSHVVPEDGMVTCPTPGIYVVTFDNSYSWARSKTLHYCVDVLKPGSGDVYDDLNTVVLNGDWSKTEDENKMAAAVSADEKAREDAVEKLDEGNDSTGCETSVDNVDEVKTPNGDSCIDDGVRDIKL